MNRLFLQITAFLFFLHLTTVKGQIKTSETLIETENLLSDVYFLKSALEEAHPSLFRFQPKDSIEAIFKTAGKKVDHPINQQEFKILMQKLIAKIGSGHTYFIPTPSSFNRKIHHYFPFLISVKENRIFIYKGLDKKYDQYVGCEITSIQNKPALEVLNNVRSYLPGEGFSNMYKDYKIEKSMAFINSYYELYGFKAKFEIGVKDTLQQESKQVFNAFFYNNADKSYISYLVPKLTLPAEMRSIHYPDSINSTAILKIRSFNYDYNESRAFIEDSFKSLKKRRIKNLIIDIRGNSGGANFSALDILRYTINTKFQFVNDYYAPVEIPSFNSFILNRGTEKVGDVPFVNRPKGGYTINNIAKKPVIPYNELSFKGNIYLLTDGGTYSSASMFAACLKANRTVTIIGQETGGMEEGSDVSPFPELQLPYSKLILNFPRSYATVVANSRDKGQGILPDIEIRASPFDLYSKTDAVLKKVKDIINAQFPFAK